MQHIIDPERPIIDPHHHLWDIRRTLAAAPPEHPFLRAVTLSPLYLLPEYLADLGSGHNVVASVFVECGAYYRAGATAALRPVGETEFVNGVAAMSASGLYGPARACAGIVAHADLTLGDAVADVLAAHRAAAPDRLRGIRHSVAWDADPAVLGFLQSPRPHMLAQPAFRAGLAQVAAAGLSYDVWLLAPQLPDLIAMAQALPQLTIICDHVATPVGIAAHAGRRDAGHAEWLANIRALAACPNVVMKLGGLAMAFGGFDEFMADPMASAAQLANSWRPWIEPCITAFGPDRCMFESNFPVDRGTCDYATLWNAFKLIAASASEAEKTALFSGTAARVYRLSV
ncbi:MAG: amidohydrolase family protein [Alphaproteobacteria bacterium]|nr:amidohydrolase family protein [Alphaproteobacteria bacterium]